MYIIRLLQKLSTTRLWLLSVLFSIASTEIIVCGMELLLKGGITYDYLLTGFVASLCVASLVAAILTFFIGQQKQAAKNVEGHSAALAEMNELLLQENSFSNDIINNLAGIFYMLDDHGRILRWNRKLEEVTGYSPGELAQMQVLDFFCSDEQALITEKIKEVFEKGESSVEAQLVIKGGQEIPYYFSACRTAIGENSYLMGIGIDVSERKLAEEALRDSQSNLEALFESMSNGAVVYRVSPDGRDFVFTAVNRAAECIERMGRDELIGKNLGDVFPDIVESGLLDVLWRVWESGVPEEFSMSSYKDGHVSGCRDSYVYKLPSGEIVVIFDDVTEKKQAQELIWHQANFDTLTGLPNRRMFRDRLEQEIKKANRADLPMALLFIDLDRFKEVNDTLGHNTGDLLLVEAARRICDCVRETDTVARLGGDEFTVILAELAEPGSIERIAQNIVNKLADPFELGRDMAFVSASIGITLYPNDAEEIDNLLKHADQAMYVAKNAGRNRYSYFTPTLQHAAQKRMRLVNDLRGALDNNQFMVYYQPIVELATGSIHKAEALIRWKHPVRGMVNPAEFISQAEESGLIHEIGEWVFRESANQVKRLRAMHHPAFQISVNKSPTQFRNDGNLNKPWPDHLQAMELPGQGIVVEITEGLLLDVTADVTAKLLAFHNAGIQVSLDDFGTGYSSLSYLKKFDIDYLKIDQSFVSNLEEGSDDMALCEAIIVMAHKLGLKVIAEGVETPGQRDILVAFGCDYAQGYLFSKAVPSEEFEALLERTNGWIAQK